MTTRDTLIPIPVKPNPWDRSELNGIGFGASLMSTLVCTPPIIDEVEI